jgi:membrane fusion protein (multidrug efflux system)
MARILSPRSFLVPGAVLALVGCARGGDAAAGLKLRDAGAGDPVPVEVVTLGRGTIKEALRFSTNLEAEVSVEVLSRAAGRVRDLQVEEGRLVKRGQVLVRLENDEQRSALDRVTIELEHAQRLFDKQKRLYDQGGVSEQEVETAEFELKRLRIAQNDAARALRYTVVDAPVGGTITQRLVDRGDFVNPNQPLFQIVDFDSIVARVYVPEKEMGKLRPDLTARLLAQATGELLREATVDRVAPVVDPKSGTIKVTLAIPKTAGLRPGMFVDVELLTDERTDAVLLPRRALVYDDDVPYAFRVVGDRVERVRVVPALEGRDFLEPREGFSAGDQVVVAGQVGLRDRALVAPKPAPRQDPAPTAGSAAAAADPGPEARPAPAEPTARAPGAAREPERAEAGAAAPQPERDGD